MINISINGDFLDLFADTTVSVNFSNNNTSSDGGSFVTYSDNVEIPLTERNAYILGVDIVNNTIDNKIKLGSISRGGSEIMSVTLEVQSVLYGELEPTISLLVMDAVSGIMNELKKKKLDIIFDEKENYVYYMKHGVNMISNELYSYGMINTTGYDDNTNMSKDNKYAYTSRIGREAVPRIVFNVNEVMSRVFKHFGLSVKSKIDNDIYTTIPYKDLSNQERLAYMCNLSCPIYAIPYPKTSTAKWANDFKSLINSGLSSPSQPNSNGFNEDEMYLSKISTETTGDFFNIPYTVYYRDREFAIKPFGIIGLVGTKIKMAKSNTPSRLVDVNYTDIKSVYLTVIVRRENTVIDEVFKLAKLNIDSNGVVVSVEELKDYLYIDKLNIKSGERVSFMLSLAFSGNSIIRCNDGGNTNVLNIESGKLITSWHDYYAVLDINEDADVGISMLFDDNEKTNESSNDIIWQYDILPDFFGKALNKEQYDVAVEDLRSRGFKPSEVKRILRNIVDLKSSMKYADITAYDFVKDYTKRFNKKLIISSDSVSDSSLVDGEIVISDEINSGITLTPKSFDNEIRDFSISNKMYNSYEDKLYNGKGSFDLPKIILNEDNKKSVNIMLESSLVPDKITGGSYVVSDSEADLISNIGVLVSGICQDKLSESSEVDFRYGYMKSSNTKVTSLFPTNIQTRIINYVGDYRWSGVGSVNYTPKCGVVMNCSSSGDALLAGNNVKMDIGATVYSGSDLSGAKVEKSFVAQYNDGLLIIDVPSIKDFGSELYSGSMTLKLRLKDELKRNGVSAIGDEYEYITYTSMKRIPVFTMRETVDNGVYTNFLDESSNVSVIYSGINADMKINFNFNKYTDLASEKRRLCIPVGGFDILPISVLGHGDYTYTKDRVPDISIGNEEILGISKSNVLLSYNDEYSLSFNDDTSNGKINAYTRYFKSDVDSMKLDNNPYIDVEVMISSDNAKKLISGYNIDLKGNTYKVVDSSDINIGENSIVKIKLSK